MATLLKERSTYWVRTNGSSHHSSFDYRTYWKIYYEQSEADKKLLRTKITVDYYLQTYWDGDSLSLYDTTNSNVYINGSSIGTISMNTKDPAVGTKLVKKGSKSTYVYHNKDGTGSFTFRGTGFDLSTATSTYSLPKINVGTEITNNTSSNSYIDLDSEVTFTLKPLTGQVEANKLYYKINDVEYIITESTTDTSFKYSFPVDIITNFSNNANISLTVYCKNLVSNVETTTTVYLKLPDSYVPTASLSIEDAMENKPEVLKDLWIKNKSEVKGTITAEGVKGSTIKSYLSSISGFSQPYNTNPFTTQPLTIAGSRTISSTITDSRDRKKTITQTINVIDYTKPTFASLVVKRCLQDGTLSESGTYAKVICKYSISPINNLNTMSLNVKLNNGSIVNIPLTSYSGEVSKVAFSGISQANSYTITATLTDLFGNVSQEFLLGVAYKTVSKRAGGKGITFGAVATEDGFHNYMPSWFYKDVQVDGNIVNGLWFGSDVTNSFQTSIFGSNNSFSRFKVIRSSLSNVDYFPKDSTGIAFCSGDTHGYIMPHYNNGTCYIGAGNANKLNWVKEVEWAWQTIWTGTLLGGNTLNLNVASYSKLKVYARCHSTAFAFEVDLNQVIKPQVTGYDYGGGGVSAYINNDNIIEHHSCEINVNTAKTVIFARHLGYTRGGTTYLRNDNESYFIYKIEAK